MDALTFFVEMVKALAWPVTILVIFLFLRRPLMQLVPFLQRFRYGALELDFGRRIQELAMDVQREVPVVGGEDGQEHLTEYMKRLAQLSPRAVILESWLQLEATAVDALNRHGIKLTSQEQRSPLLLGQALAQAGVLDEAKQQIFYRLRNLRNAATHAADFDFEPEAASEYAEAARRLTNFIRSV